MLSVLFSIGIRTDTIVKMYLPPKRIGDLKLSHSSEKSKAYGIPYTVPGMLGRN